jgi:hypothetical protein
LGFSDAAARIAAWERGIFALEWVFLLEEGGDFLLIGRAKGVEKWGHCRRDRQGGYQTMQR